MSLRLFPLAAGLSRLSALWPAALDKAIGWCAHVRLRVGARSDARVRVYAPPKNYHLNMAVHYLQELERGERDISASEIQFAMLRALCGIGEMLHELRPDITIEDHE